MAVIRPPLFATVVPDSVLLDVQIDALAFRLLVLLHADAQGHLVDEGDLARTLDVFRSAVDEAFGQLERAGYLVRTIAGDWQVTPWE